MRSDSKPQNSRPTPLHKELTAINVAPYATRVAGSMEGSASPQTSCSSDDWKLLTEIPAEMLKKKTSHKTMNLDESRQRPMESAS